MIIDQRLGTRSARVAAIDFENRSVRIFRSARVENACMMKKIEALSRAIARDGWSSAGVHRLVALVEEDGRETAAEERDLRAVLARDRFLGRGAKRELSSYLDFIRRARASAEALPRKREPALFEGRDLDPARYRRHVELLAGERPISAEAGRESYFHDRYLASAKNQLNEVAEWLADYYRMLGLEVLKEPVAWEGETYFNLRVRFRGSVPETILLCDHYDVADKEHLLPRARAQLSKEFRSAREGTIPLGAAVPGADDNASATAVLMEMGALMRHALDRGAELKKTIELVHLVGEELPADCLGARTFVANAKREQRKISAVLVLDMIGVDRKGTKKVQLSPGKGSGALALAAEVKRAIADLHLDLRPVLRPYGSRKSFLHQTDGIHFSSAGIPVVLLNEHVNDDHDRYRAGYHDEFDITALMSFDYAANIARAALETTYRLATAGADHLTNIG